MFVATGATQRIRHSRKQAVYAVRLKELLNAANSLGITKEELIEQIQSEDNGK